MITTRPRPSRQLHDFVGELLDIFPNSYYYKRGAAAPCVRGGRRAARDSQPRWRCVRTSRHARRHVQPEGDLPVCDQFQVHAPHCALGKVQSVQRVRATCGCGGACTSGCSRTLWQHDHLAPAHRPHCFLQSQQLCCRSAHQGLRRTHCARAGAYSEQLQHSAGPPRWPVLGLVAAARTRPCARRAMLQRHALTRAAPCPALTPPRRSPSCKVATW